ncbi:MAG TPA: flagellar protein FlaG [Spirochaetota bacterium]|nr:flagellar protein FlaG [Spirochaetota bacterium]HRZ27536.1 flagellar protein FlaG [Spirochaetota bacterium]HSA14965.1 flagellar protein FlaG [Spirochaetota bacterium]
MNVGNISNLIIDKVDTINRVRQSEAKNPEYGKGSGEAAAAKSLTKKEIYESLDRLNAAMSDFNERISFSYHEKTNRIIVKVIDSHTNEVVREIPPKDMIKLLEHLKDSMGILVDESR